MAIIDTLESPLLQRILKDMQAVSRSSGVEFFGLGAVARNVWYVDHDLPARGTQDVDFGVYVADVQTYQQLRAGLINSYGYHPAQNPFCLISPDGVPVDLLPFGEIEDNGKVLLEGQGLTELSLEGFQEVYDSGLRPARIQDIELTVSSIPGIVMLKLIAFDDRPGQRVKDALDIASILQYYPVIEQI